MSDSPPEKDIQWSNQGVTASYKFLQKIWSLNSKVIERKNPEISKEIEEKLQVTKEEIFFISAATGEGTEFLLKSLESEIYKNKKS